MKAPFTDDELMKLAGECVKCAYYDYEEAQFTVNCYQCNRYWGDLFEPREEEEKP